MRGDVGLVVSAARNGLGAGWGARVSPQFEVPTWRLVSSAGGIVGEGISSMPGRDTRTGRATTSSYFYLKGA
ncbi:hypothetical protein MO867_00090 [Microbulbifer sp. OS29]|uniref:Uncharacterized protein n=1 Tax=Microbulbifer okhotskensis TaxID=2926617 RepID=A0A9X2EN91_9GAMM|nr:hypothetical protein [Microbulbifer okhotskensis]MCO1332723.1 hypothetical protein [Microbulbifer okhotskensis]